MKTKNDLLLFYAHENCPARATALPTLAWLAESKGMEYDGYFCVKPSVADIGDALPFTGNQHHQQFALLMNFFDHIHFYALTEEASIQFERFLSGRGNATILKKKADELADFYREIFKIFEEPFPDSAVVFSSKKFPFPNERVELGDFLIEGESRLDSFCYPEIYFRQAVGIHYELSDSAFEELKKLGIAKIFLIFCPQEAEKRFSEMGFEVEVIDQVLSDDNYLTVTERIARRWMHEGKGFAIGNDPITLRWTPKYLRERILALGAVKSLPEAVLVLAELTEKVGNKLVWGSQVFNDHFIAEVSKHDIVLSLAHDVEVGFTIRDKISLPNLWLDRTSAPWEDEFSDEELQQIADEGKIPVCFLHYASDLGHLPVLPRLLDLLSLDGFKGGIGFPASWWEYVDDMLEQIYLSKKMGGVFPACEPLISSAGTGVATEARGYLSQKAYLENLQAAREIIKNKTGEKHIPIGHYSFQDACPRYEHDTAEPQFDVLIEAGFEYAISYKKENQFPQILHATGNFIAINQQVEHWSFDPLRDVKVWEEKLISASRKGWIMIGLDSPFWGMVPCYFGVASKGLSLTDLQAAMSYVKNGGKSGKLVMAKPHEVARFARIIKLQKPGFSER